MDRPLHLATDDAIAESELAIRINPRIPRRHCGTSRRGGRELLLHAGMPQLRIRHRHRRLAVRRPTPPKRCRAGCSSKTSWTSGSGWGRTASAWTWQAASSRKTPTTIGRNSCGSKCERIWTKPTRKRCSYRNGVTPKRRCTPDSTWTSCCISGRRIILTCSARIRIFSAGSSEATGSAETAETKHDGERSECDGAGSSGCDSNGNSVVDGDNPNCN